MIALDANVLLYAYSATSPFNAQASRWLENVMAQRTDLGLPWQSALAFLRLMTNPAVYGQAASMHDAASVIEELLSHSNVYFLAPGRSHWAIFMKLLKDAQVTRNLLSDAHLAALALEHGATLCTNDRDFSRFPGLKIFNPVAKQ